MKRILSLIMAIALVFALSACKKTESTLSEINESVPTQTEAENTDTSTGDTATTAEADTAEETDTAEESSNGTENPSDSTGTPTTSPNTSKPTTSSNYTTITPSTSKPSHTHSFSTATCTEPKKCSCGAINGSALGHNYENGVCKVCKSTDPNHIKYTVTYNANGGWGETKSSNHIYNETRSLSNNGFKRAGYTFIGWSTDANAKSPQYTNTQSVKNLTTTNGKTIILYAVWKESKTSKFDECQRAIQGKKEVEYHTTATDNFGVVHNDVAIFVNRDSYPAEKRYDERYVNGMFSKIKGTLFLSNHYTINSYTKIQLIIKADGAVVYKSDFFTKYSGSQSFEVDISGTNVIEIYVADPISAHIEAWNKGGDIIIENLTLIR